MYIHVVDIEWDGEWGRVSIWKHWRKLLGGREELFEECEGREQVSKKKRQKDGK